ncbi:hypothetical protein MYX84_10490 [Acidobacteria bacterium AH-259-O06]|nr:hypothetical protein [Acidobacteria bacterium AH-259-O06]
MNQYELIRTAKRVYGKNIRQSPGAQEKKEEHLKGEKAGEGDIRVPRRSRLYGRLKENLEGQRAPKRGRAANFVL